LITSSHKDLNEEYYLNHIQDNEAEIGPIDDEIEDDYGQKQGNTRTNNDDL